MHDNLTKHFFNFPIEKDHLLYLHAKAQRTSISELARKLLLEDMQETTSENESSNT